MDIKYESMEDLLKKGEESLEVEFKDIDVYNRLKSKKGGIGQMMEESHFGYAINNNSAPDFENLDTELKVTPFYISKNKYIAKERLVLNIINYMKENWSSFYDSHFWYKNKQILMQFYEYDSTVEREFWKIKKQVLYTYPDEDLEIIKQDWQKIAEKVKAGKAHELSEGDTLYLGACTKGATAASSLREQPFSSEPAKQRAYSFKQSYMTYLLNSRIFNDIKYENLIKSSEEINGIGLEGYIKNKIRPYLGKTQKELIQLLNIKTKSKNINSVIINKILQLKGDIKNSSEFLKANIIPKTIRIEKNGSVRESMSFSPFKFKNLVLQEWDNSDFYEYLSNTKFMFIIFKKSDNDDLNSIFTGIKFWNMPSQDIEMVKKTWIEIVEIIKKGVILTPYYVGKKLQYHNNFPKVTDKKIIHVRPHSNKAAYLLNNIAIGNINDANELPDGRWMTTQSFWLNNDYIKEILEGN